MRLTFPSCTDELYGDRTYSVVVDSTLLGSKNVWSGSSLSEVADKMNKDIDLHEENINRLTHNPDSDGAE